MAGNKFNVHTDRPSSWPVRTERRRCAAAEHNHRVYTFLEEILARLSSIEAAVNARPDAIPAPPGLQSTSEDGDSKNNTKLVDRIELLEKVYVLTDWEALESTCDALSTSTTSGKLTTVTKCSGVGTGDDQSPHASLSFDIFDQREDASVQTIVTTENARDMETQTVGLNEWRQNQCDNMAADLYKELKGTWTPINNAIANDMVRVVTPFVDSTVGVQIQLPKDVVGKIIQVDAEGDALVRFPGLAPLIPGERSRWILASAFQNMERLEAT